MTQSTRPPMDPDTSEASERQLELAREQGAAYGRALQHMTGDVAHDGGEQEAGHFLVGYAVEEAEGMYEWVDGKLVWREPGDANVHLEVAVRDAADGRFVPGVTVSAVLVAPGGEQLGPYELELLWHPMIYHYGRNLKLPADGRYALRVHVEPPTFVRHDERNGCRFTEPVDVEFAPVEVERGRD